MRDETEKTQMAEALVTAAGSSARVLWAS